MLISDCPFYCFSGKIYRPVLALRIINPHSSKSYQTFGIIDTGADECAIPASVAHLLGHNLKKGTTKEIGTGNGLATAYTHTIKFEIYHPVSGKFLYAVNDTPIDFMPNLNIVLLGVNSFLSRFILTVDYPKKSFSLNYP
ncbi:MAG: retropepsin-like aspartic protease [Candidatus Anammoxibacter sp.]